MRACLTRLGSVSALLVAGCAGTPEPMMQRQEGYATMQDGVRLYYAVRGDGPQTVLVPVGFYLEDALASLATTRRRVVFYDPRNRGRSDRGPLASVSLDRQIEDLERLRQHLGADSVALVGWSGLGMEMAVYALRHPRRVTRLVQMSAVPPAASIMRERGDQRAAWMDTAAVNALDARFDRGEFNAQPAEFCRLRNRLSLPANFADTSYAALVPDICQYENEWPVHLWPYFGRLLGSFGDYDWRNDVGGLRVPRLVIHGRQDGVPLEGARAWARYPEARLMIVEGAGHFPFLEHRDLVLDALYRFLDGEWPAAAMKEGA